MSNPLQDGIDFYIEEGNFVFLEKFHLDRGDCCENECRHCPFQTWGERSSYFFDLDIAPYEAVLGTLESFEEHKLFHSKAKS